MVVFLNGPSSSGKTAIARALQEKWDGPLLHVGIDTLITMMPFDYTGSGTKSDEGFHFCHDSDEVGPIVRVRHGPLAKRLSETFSEMTAVLVRNGHDVVVDEVTLEADRLRSYVKHLAGARVYFVGVRCGLRELESRETTRGDRLAHLARGQAALVHQDPRFYDIVLDSTETDPLTLADEVLSFMQVHPQPESFASLARAFAIS
jgi:chloramphenicol 3-O phosphotransferase